MATSDPGLFNLVRAWRTKALLDYQAAQHLAGMGEEQFLNAAYHCQQAIEKGMKSFLTYHQVAFGKTHSLEFLGSLCEEIDPALKELIDPVTRMTEYESSSRYPDGEPLDLDRAEVDRSLVWVERWLIWLDETLPVETRPDLIR